MKHHISFLKVKSLVKIFSNKIVLIIIIALLVIANIAFLLTRPSPPLLTQNSSKNVLKSKIEFLASFAVSVSSFKQIAATDYAKAIIIISNENGMRKLHHINKAMWKAPESQIGWSVFFNSTVKVYAGGDVKAPVVGYYNPFSDVFLVTAWKEHEGIYKIVDADLLMGDFIRNKNETFDVLPYWLRGKTYRPESLGSAVALSVLAFEHVFKGATSDTWRNKVPLLIKQNDLNEVNYSLSALRLNEQLINILRFSLPNPTNKQIKSCQSVTLAILNKASNGNISKILDAADGTPGNTAKRLKEISPEWFLSLKVAAVLINEKSGFVFLSPTKPTNCALAISFMESGGGFQVERIDLVDYQFFYENRTSIQGDHNNGGVK